MTGPEHYTQGEKYLTDAAEYAKAGYEEAAAAVAAVAQAHFTAAQAAATALARSGMTATERAEWARVAGGPVTFAEAGA